MQFHDKKSFLTKKKFFFYRPLGLKMTILFMLIPITVICMPMDLWLILKPVEI